MSDSSDPQIVTSITVAVFHNGVPLYVLDAAGRAFASDDPDERAVAAGLLARATVALVEMPPAEPSLTATGLYRLLEALEEVGTPEAETAHAALGEAREILTAALDMTNAALRSALPTEH